MLNDKITKYIELLNGGSIDYDELLTLVNSAVELEKGKRLAGEQTEEKTDWALHTAELVNRINGYEQRDKKEYEDKVRDNTLDSEVSFCISFLSNIVNASGERIYPDELLNDDKLSYYEMLSMLNDFRNSSPVKYAEIINKLKVEGVAIPEDFDVEEVTKDVEESSDSIEQTNDSEKTLENIEQNDDVEKDEEYTDENNVIEIPGQIDLPSEVSYGLPSGYDNDIINLPNVNQPEINNEVYDDSEIDEQFNNLYSVDDNEVKEKNSPSEEEISHKIDSVLSVDDEIGKDIASAEENKNNKPKAIFSANEGLKNKMVSLKSLHIADIGKVTAFCAAAVLGGVVLGPAGLLAAGVGANVAAAINDAKRVR